MKHKIQYLFFFLALPFSMMAENASNVRVRQQGKDIIVTYDLRAKSNVRLFVSINNSAFQLLEAVEGAVGSHVQKGENLTIIWHPLREKDSFIAQNVRFKVDAIGSYEEYAMPKINGGKTDIETFILGEFAYSPVPQISGGFTLGQTYIGLGWFVTIHSNFNFQSATDGMSCNEGGYIDDILPFYSDRTQSSAFTANAGLVWDILDVTALSTINRFNTFGFYLGGGYGWRRMLWETVDGKWIEYGSTSIRGFSGNIGLIGSVYGLTLKAGVNTINFKYLELEAGIGWMF